MSYKEFANDMNEFCKALGPTNKFSLEECYASIRDRWIAEGKVDGLISFVIENWDYGNCDDFIVPIERLLINAKDTERYRTMWIGILQHRLDCLRRYMRQFKNALSGVSASEISNEDVSGYNCFSREDHSDPRRTVAYYRLFLLEGIKALSRGLREISSDCDLHKIESLKVAVDELRPPRHVEI